MELWVFFYAGLFLAGLIGVGLGFVVLEIMEYANHGWKQYTLTENEWDFRDSMNKPSKDPNGELPPTWPYQKAIERLALLEESQFNLKYGFMWGRYDD